MTTVQRRLLWLLLPSLGALMLVGGLVDYWIAVSSTREAYDQSLASTAYAAAAALSTRDGVSQFAPSERTLSLLAGTSDAMGGATLYAVTDEHGALLAGTTGLPRAVARGRGGRAAFADVVFAGQSLRLVTIAVGTGIGTAHVSVAESVARRQRTERAMLLGKLLVDFIELDLTLLIAWVAVHFGLRSLHSLRERVEEQGSREWQRLDDTQVPGELRPVVVAFNRVLELLHVAASAQRRFVADAAHQIRTPVAGLQGQIELLLREPRAAALAGELDQIHHGIQRLARVANQLLSLARAEPAAAAPDAFTDVALHELVRTQVEQYLDRADTASIDLGADAQAATVRADGWMLEDALSNLIDNALKYGRAGGHVTVRCGLQGARPFLEVEDDGPGIPEGERQRVRERFYRRPGSAGIGSGLGMAIVDEIARVHGAQLIIGEGSDGHGSRIRLLFLRASPRAT